MNKEENKTMSVIAIEPLTDEEHVITIKKMAEDEGVIDIKPLEMEEL